MDIPFTKMHALGNNYIYVNQQEEQIPEHLLPQVAIEVANVRTGIGSDGLILICPSDHADVKMRVFNADGSEAKNCGNGLRCVARYVYEKGMVSQEQFQIETLGGMVQAQVLSSSLEVHSGESESTEADSTQTFQVKIDMGEPGLTKGSVPIAGSPSQSSSDMSIQVGGKQHSFVGVSMGNPHAVFFVEDVEQAPVETLGPKVEKHELFPEGTNVEFIRVRNGQEIDFRVWERGSGVTHACGTGACAAVVAATLQGQVQRGQEVTVHLLGGDLYVTWQEDGRVWMRGSAAYVCEGRYFFLSTQEQKI